MGLLFWKILSDAREKKLAAWLAHSSSKVGRMRILVAPVGEWAWRM
jgi:hypothetical protein